MSIYTKNKQLRDLLEKTNLEFSIPVIKNSIVATMFEKNREKKLMIDDYTEKKLEEIVKSKKYNKVIIDHNFWNYNYCTSDNLDKNNLSYYTKNLKTIFIDLDNFPSGYLTMISGIYDILHNIFVIEDDEELLNYLSDLNIDRNAFANYLINNPFMIPLTKNYIELIKRIFDNDNIFDFLFKKSPIFSPEETKVILKNFTIENINEQSFYIYTSDISDIEKLKYTEVFIDLYQDIIDSTNIIYLSMNNFKPTLGLYLLNMYVEEEYINYYYFIIGKFIDNNGAINIKIIDDKKLNKFLEERISLINEYFNL